MRSCPSFALLIMFCVLAQTAHGENEPLLLKLDRTFNVMPRSGSSSPAFITASHMTGQQGNQLEAVGNAELHKEGHAIFADRLTYQQNSREVTADGAVRIEQNGDVISGSHLDYNLDTNIGKMTQAGYHLADSDARGSADVLDMNGKGNYSLHNVSYTTCPAGNDDWMLKMGELDIDRTTQVGDAHSAFLEFKGVPFLYSPWMDFALNGQRKSGLLAPIFASTTTGGTEVTLPFYWNLAPNYDATIAPRIMAKRGLLLNNQFRYLGENYYGELELDALPQDQLAHRSRIHQSYTQTQNLGGGFNDTVNLNRVSDDAYYRDLSTSVAGTSQVNLVREGVLTYSGDGWNAATRVQNFQTLQDPLLPVAIPYKRTPQVTLNALRQIDDANAAFTGEYVNFSHPTSVNGQRLVLYPTVSYPLLYDSAYFVTPKIGLHHTSYTFGINNTAAIPNADRTLPILSLDSGMAFERESSFQGLGYVQTLEPRAYFVYIPYRNQDMLPNFDSAQAPFSFSQIFTENRFLGSDRIGDANQVTLAATSRLIDARNGMERLRITMGQRFSFEIPKVNLVAPTATTNKSDILLGASGRMTDAIWLDSLWQYNPSQSRSETFNASARYQPESGKLLNLGYRYARDTMRQADISEQWPLYGRWHSVARFNYSLLEKRMLEGLVGLEYNQDCWVGRLVMQRFTTSTQQVSTGIFVQLDLTGLAGIGSDPLEALRRSIPGYTKLNQNVPSGTPQGLQ